jgi:hypothetical protein
VISLASIAAGFVWLVVDQGLAGLTAAALLVGVLLVSASFADRWR